jgi:hypothetical protein
MMSFPVPIIWSTRIVSACGGAPTSESCGRTGGFSGVEEGGRGPAGASGVAAEMGLNGGEGPVAGGGCRDAPTEVAGDI